MDDGFLSFFSEIGDVMLEIDAADVVVRCYGPLERLGAPAHTLCGRAFDNVLPLEASYPLRRAIQRLRETGEGQTIEFLWSGDPLRYFEARIAGSRHGHAIVLLRDIHERKNAQLEAACSREQLFESEIRFRSMADHAPVLLWMAGTDGLCTFFNQRWMEFTGRPIEKETGVGWAEGVHPEDFQGCMNTYMEAFVARLDFNMEYRLRRADGEYRWIYDQGTPRIAPDGSFLGYIGSCVDVTDIRNARETLRRLNEELELRVEQRTAALKSAMQELEAFSYSVSHDLRSPLRAIDGFSDILLGEYGERLDARGRHMLEETRNASQRMDKLIEALLKLSRISRADLKRRTVDISEIAREVLQDLGRREPHRTIETRVQDELTASADDRLLRSLLENLIGNAWKFTGKREHPQISLSAERANGSVVFAVRDNGAGFDMKYSSKLFYPFQRLHSDAEFRGSGIGLATVQRIVRLHGGKIWAEAAVDEGAAFFFTLPETS